MRVFSAVSDCEMVIGAINAEEEKLIGEYQGSAEDKQGNSEPGKNGNTTR